MYVVDVSVGKRYLHLSCSTLDFETSSLAEPKTCHYGQTRYPASFRYLHLLLCLSSTEILIRCHPSWLLYIEIVPSCLQGKYFAELSPQLQECKIRLADDKCILLMNYFELGQTYTYWIIIVFVLFYFLAWSRGISSISVCRH